MTKTLINFKADPEQAARWRAALEKDGRTLSEVCRAALDRIASRAEKMDAEKLTKEGAA